MAVKQMGITTGGNVSQWIGTHAERLTFEATFAGGAGSTFWEKDTKTGWVWDGSAFNAV